MRTKLLAGSEIDETQPPSMHSRRSEQRGNRRDDEHGRPGPDPDRTGEQTSGQDGGRLEIAHR
jgi:hypothetical protein